MKNLTQSIRDFVELEKFHNFILGVIIFNAVILGFMTSTTVMEHAGGVLDWLSTICQVIFVIEIVLRLIAHRWRFFKGGWNWFDFIIVAATMVPATSTISAMRAVRVLRVFRTLRIMSSIKQLRIIITAILESMPSVMWTVALLLIFFYIYAIIGQSIFAEKFPQWFGTLGEAMYTLFQIMTLESWSMGISRPVMAEFPFAWIYFVSFVMISSYTIINVIVGIVVNAISEIAEHERVSVTKEGIETERDDSYMIGETSTDKLLEQLASMRQTIAEMEKQLQQSGSDRSK